MGQNIRALAAKIQLKIHKTHTYATIYEHRIILFPDAVLSILRIIYPYSLLFLCFGLSSTSLAYVTPCFLKLSFRLDLILGAD